MTSRKSDSALPPELVESMANSIQPIELSAAQRDRMRRRIMREARDTTPEGTATVRSEEAEWKEVAPFIEVRELSRDERAGTHVSLVRMKPGGIIRPHIHSKEEDFIILEGECDIGSHRLCVGDSHRATPGSRHEQITTRSGVLVLVRGEFPYPPAER